MNKKYFAEFLGTFALVFCGTGAIIVDKQIGGGISLVGIAITFGLIVAAMIYALGSISGAHMNPAVTVAFVIARRFPAKEVLPYAISQVLGAFLASGILKLMFPESNGLGTTLPSGPPLQSFFMEVILTFILMLVIIHVATGSKEQGMFAGIAVGSVVCLEAICGGPVCGASMNPVRSLAPAIVSGQTGYLWIYLTAPFIGALLAIGAWNLLRSHQ
jgi:aquaporin NIP